MLTAGQSSHSLVEGCGTAALCLAQRLNPSNDVAELLPLSLNLALKQMACLEAFIQPLLGQLK
jgi:hypothetical protein